MNILDRITPFTERYIMRGAGIAALCGLALCSPALADGPTSMAPPIQSTASQETGVNAATDSVFNWSEIPADQQVPLQRATFDQGGYQLYDTAGETIVVPFADQNLYVMKFAESPTGKLYFINTGGCPVLYLPKNGSLENATVPGARWYPFGQDFHPSEPVFLGIAPSYPEFIDLGWYPETAFYGGYYGRTSFLAGGLFLPTVGLFFEIGGQPYYGWNSYQRYYAGHPGFSRTSYYRRDYYHTESRPGRDFRGYAGAGGFGAGRSNGGQFGGVRSGEPGHTYYAHRAFQGAGAVRGHVGSEGRSGFSGSHDGFSGSHDGFSDSREGSHSSRSNFGGSHVFHGAGDSRPSSGPRPEGGSHTFQGSPDGFSGRQNTSVNETRSIDRQPFGGGRAERGGGRQVERGSSSSGSRGSGSPGGGNRGGGNPGGGSRDGGSRGSR